MIGIDSQFVAVVCELSSPLNQHRTPILYACTYSNLVISVCYIFLSKIVNKSLNAFAIDICWSKEYSDPYQTDMSDILT